MALHEARKKTKRTRYAAEAAVPALGGRAEEAVRDMKALQGLLGDHQDSVMARRTLRELAAVAHAAGRATSRTGCCTRGGAPRAGRRGGASRGVELGQPGVPALSAVRETPPGGLGWMVTRP